MSTQPQEPESFVPARPLRASAATPVQALNAALEDTLRLLFRPFDAHTWIKLSLVCLFLGGGTPSAAFHWSLGTLPADIHLSESLAQMRQYITEHLWLILLTILAGLALGLAWLYFRAVFRFVLVDCLLRRDVSMRSAWKAVHPLGRSYFFWLLGLFLALGGSFAAGAILAFPHLRAAAAEETHKLALYVVLIGTLVVVVLTGLLVAVVIALTDDLAVPMMYAGRFSLPASWRRLWTLLRTDSASFVIYVLVRFAVSVAVGVAVLFFLFPALVSVFSGAIIAAALVVLGLHLVGVSLVWNPLTIVVAIAALGLLTVVLLVLLSVVGMPGQVLLQSFGIRFIAPRAPTLEALRRMPVRSRAQ